jgi:WD repeat-containing protein 70
LQKERPSSQFNFTMPNDSALLPLLPLDAHLSGGASLLTNNGARIELSPKTSLAASKKCLIVGRQAATADIRIQHGSISRRHTAIYYTADQLMVSDLGGKHGTHVNGERITGTRQLQDGDTIVFGQVKDSVFTVEYKIAKATTEPIGEIKAETAMEKSKPPDPLEGLSGRARREAEIAQMMSSLDEKPVYEVYRAPPETAVAATKEEATVAQKYNLPLTDRFDIASPSDEKSTLTSLCTDPSGARFALGGKHLSLFDFSSLDQHRQSPFKTLEVEEGYNVVDIAYSNTGDRVIVGTGSVSPRILGRDGELVMEFIRGDMYVTDMARTTGHTASVTGVAWHPLERDVVLTSSTDGSARLWNLNGKTQFHKLVCDKVYRAKNERGQRTGVTSVVFHPGGREFALGTACGSIQIWSTARVGIRPERVVFDKLPITSLVYNFDGSRLASRSPNSNVVKVWDVKQMSPSCQPMYTLEGLPNEHERANSAFSPDGKYLTAGTSEYTKGQDGRRVEKGLLKVFKLGDQPSIKPVSSILELDMRIGVVMVQWHAKINQVFVGCSDGSAVVFYDTQLSKKGALISSAKAGKAQDSLATLLKSRLPTGSAGISGEIITPLYQPGGPKRKRKDDEDNNKSRAPQAPATGKYKIGSQSGASLTLQQFVANSSINQTKAIAGKDPREELFKFNSGKTFVDKAYDTQNILAEKTVEQEEDEANTNK